MHSKLAYHITSLNLELIRPRTINPEQHFLNKEELCHNYSTKSTLQWNSARQIQPLCFHLHKGSGILCWLSIISEGCQCTLVWQLWQTQGQSCWLSPCTARNSDSTLPDLCRELSNYLLLFWTFRQKSISARNKSQSEGISLHCSTSPGFTRWKAQPGNYCNSLSQLLAQRRSGRSTQTPHKWGHIADHTVANSCPIHRGRGQEADGALKLRVATFRCEH